MTVSTAVSFGPRRIALWGLVWALAVAACETLLAYRLDDMRLAPLAGWLMLHWLVPLWWLNGCALVWIVQRAERHAGVGAMAIGFLLVSLVNGLLQPVLGWLVAPLRIALAEAGLLAMMTLMPTRDLTAALELAVYNFWIGIFYGGLLMIAAVVVAA